MTYPAADGIPFPDGSLDPADWSQLRAQGHRMLDDMFDYLSTLRERPVWQPAPEAVRAGFHEPLPRSPTSLAAAHERFMRDILPYAIGNAHPGFMGWVQGGGTAIGMLAETLAAGLNANVGGRSQIPIEVERQITRWMRELFGFPENASGLFVTGTSMANLIGVLVARTTALGRAVRREGVADQPVRLTAYTSACAHGCVAQAMDIAGLGIDALRRIPVDADFRMDTRALQDAIDADRRAGFQPFLIAGTAGTVDVGAVDPLGELAAIAAREGAWFHVDGAFGALAMLSPQLAPLLAGIERADSIAFDFHKWGQVQYDAGFILVRDGAAHQAAFEASAAYLSREPRGMAAGSPWPCDYGPDLSRGFRALKTWFTLTVYGADRLGDVIARTCRVARHLERRVRAEPALELLAPVALNIVCFRYRGDDAADDLAGRGSASTGSAKDYAKADEAGSVEGNASGMDRTALPSAAEKTDRLNAAIVIALQESGIAAPSTTRVNGALAIRAAIVNHRCAPSDVDRMCDAVLAIGARLSRQAAGGPMPAFDPASDTGCDPACDSTSDSASDSALEPASVPEPYPIP